MRSFAAVDPLKTKFDAMDTQGMINEERCSGVPFHWIYHKIHVCFQDSEEQNLLICSFVGFVTFVATKSTK